MTDEINNLVLEQLRHIRATQSLILEKLDTLTHRVGSLEQLTLGFHGDLVAINQRLDRYEARLDRIEKRLDIVEA